MLNRKNLRKIVVFIALALLLVSCSAKSDDAETVVLSDASGEAVNLDWKLGEGEILAYRTSMNQIDASSATITVDWEKLFGGLVDDDAMPADFSGILTLPQLSSLISILETNAQGNITVRMIVGEVMPAESQSDNSMGQLFNNLMQDMEGTVQLRGELTPDGAIASFYLEQQQRNLLAMFFELPTHPVKVGDTWEIDVNCISMGAGFIATKANRINRIQLSELSTTSDGRPLATVDYLIAEAVEGDFRTPFGDEVTPTSMTCSFVGQGYFLIEEGRWEQFLGEFAITSTGFMSSNVVQQFALFPLDVVPQEYLDAE